jgi:hypothetical protein
MGYRFTSDVEQVTMRIAFKLLAGVTALIGTDNPKSGENLEGINEGMRAAPSWKRIRAFSRYEPVWTSCGRRAGGFPP